MAYLKWTDEMDQVIKELWPTKSARQIALILTAKFNYPFTPAMVADRRRGIPGIPDKPHYWDEEDMAYIKENYDYTKQSVSQMANELSRRHHEEISTAKVRSMIQRLGLQRSFAELGWKEWSPEEIDKLKELITERDYTVAEAAKALGRTESVTRTRVKKLKLKLLEHSTYFTGTEAAEVLGVSQSKITTLIDQGQLKARYLIPEVPIRGWRIEEEDLATFVRNYPREIGERPDVGLLLRLEGSDLRKKPAVEFAPMVPRSAATKLEQQLEETKQGRTSERKMLRYWRNKSQSLDSKYKALSEPPVELEGQNPVSNPTNDSVKIRKIGEYFDGKETCWIWLVKGKDIRDHLISDFTQGGHKYVYDRIPEDEIWIDDANYEERYAICVHEAHERNLMKFKKLSYHTSHYRANRVEKAVRNA